MSSPPSAALSDRSAVFKTPPSSSNNGRCGLLLSAGCAASTATPSARGDSETPFQTPQRRRQVACELRTPRSSARRTPGDRFIPSRSGADRQFSAYKIRSARRCSRRRSGSGNSRAENGSLNGCGRTPTAADPDSARRRERLFALRGRSSEGRVLNIRQASASSTSASCNDSYWREYSVPASQSTSARKPARKYPKTADKILDAPNLVDDFYLNVLDWSKSGILAIALGGVVYLLNTETNESSSLCSSDGSENTYISSLQWSKTGQYLAVGTSSADVQLWDVDTNKLICTMHTHDSRVNTLAWNPRTHLLSSASQSGSIHNYDIRQANFHIGTLNGHSQDVCGLQWSPSGRFLASGGDRNVVCVWDTHTRDPWDSPTHILREHTAAVKALSWCPWQPHLLASGGGSADQHICLWNACTGQLLDKIHTGSQISGLVWSAQHRELLSSHGHPHNQLAIWSYPTLSLSASLRGHQGRILHLSLSPDGESVASAGADETLRLWKCFTSAPPNHTPVNQFPSGLLRAEPLEMPGYIL